MRFILRVTVAGLLFIMLLSMPGIEAAGQNPDYAPFRRFSQVFDLVQKHYVRDVDNDELLEGALKGMLTHLDPHSSFLNAKEYKEMQETTSGEFFGVGIEISSENGQVMVVTPIEDTPAYKAGIKAGDLILAVDGQPTQDMNSQEVVSKIRGPKGTEVELLILHKDSRKPESVKIKRDAIPVISVKSRVLEDGYLLLRLTRFSERTTTELRAAISDFTKNSEMKGVILDLRNNPGGLLDQAVTVSDIFLRNGVIVSMRGRDQAQGKEYRATSTAEIAQPVVVLVNSGTASAAEIVAGALQDRKRALLIGERTFGKGSVQQVIPLSGSAALKITTALYYTPNGRSIQAEGIEPDMIIPFEIPREEDGALPRLNLREQDLSGHLENNSQGVSVDKGKNNVDPEAKTILAKDNQLRLALQVVKSLPKLQSLTWN